MKDYYEIKERLEENQSFEEQFPSLYGTNLLVDVLRPSRIVIHRGVQPSPDEEFVAMKHVQEHCLDKQKVKEVIKKLYNPQYADEHSEDIDRFLEGFKKELEQ